MIYGDKLPECLEVDRYIPTEHILNVRCLACFLYKVYVNRIHSCSISLIMSKTSKMYQTFYHAAIGNPLKLLNLPQKA